MSLVPTDPAPLKTRVAYFYDGAPLLLTLHLGAPC